MSSRKGKTEPNPRTLKAAPPSSPLGADEETDDWTSLEADVVVLGAGISGLTVAHELMERNFTVVVIDPSIVPETERGSGFENANPGVGGMAKSQWCYFPIPEGAEPRPPMSDAPMCIALPRPSWQSIRIPFPESGENLLDVAVSDVETGAARDTLEKALTELAHFLAAAQDANPPVHFSVICRTADTEAASSLHEEILRLLKELAKTPGSSTTRDFGALQLTHPPNFPTNILEIGINCFSLPGEHGFRFFPGFYRHIFDTMKRIPISVNVDGHEAVTGSVYDNLIPSDEFGYTTKRATPSIRVSRFDPQSPEKLKAVVTGLLEEAGYSPEDLAMLAGSFVKYMTSSRMRREKEYENLSWYEFVEGDRYSPRAQFLHETAPGTLLAVFGSSADARSQGSIAMQLGGFQPTDGNASSTNMLLNGPTDLAWFAHWYQYLAGQAVDFRRGRLKGIKADGTPIIVLNETETGTTTETETEVSFSPVAKIMKGVTHYVVALPLREATEVARDLVAKLEESGRKPFEVAKDFAQLVEFMDGLNMEEELKKASPEGPLKHLSGIQYFFDQDIRLWRGHTQYLDAPFGLSSVSQPQFWKIPENLASGYRTVLSVDIGIWDTPKIRGSETADVEYGWNRTREFLATEIWKQIREQHEGDFPNAWPRLPTPYAFHVDDNLLLDEKGNIIGNKSPFLVNQKGRYRSRPGLSRIDEDWRAVIDYDVAFGRCVMAGTHMQTATRITSMEAACESGRRAVNALLRHLDLSGEPCSVWDPEDYEPEGLNQFKELDRELCERGCPHPLDIVRP